MVGHVECILIIAGLLVWGILLWDEARWYRNKFNKFFEEQDKFLDECIDKTKEILKLQEENT
jgi:hypothetical protein